MAKLTITGTPAATFDCVVLEQEIRGFTLHAPTGPVNGCQWRLLVHYPATASAPARDDWLPWIFAPMDQVQAMLAHWSRFLAENPQIRQSSPLQ